MADSLGFGCDDDDKYVDPEAWWDPYFCCDQFFTSTAAFKLHKMFQPHMGAGGRGDRGGGDFFDEFFSDDDSGYFYEDFDDEDSDDKDSDDDDSADDYEDCSDEEEEEYIVNMMNLVSSSAGRSAKSKKSRSNVKATCLDRLLYNCSKCAERFAIKPEYLLHTAIIHRECGACGYKCQADQKTDELWDHEHHFKKSPSCQYSSKGKLGGCVGIVKPTEEALHSEEGNFNICLACGHHPSSIFALNQHYATAHAKCHGCKIQFETQDDLHHHLSSSKIHKGKYCHGCKMIFSSKGGFSDHCDVLHSPWTSDQARGFYACDACTKAPMSFPTEDELDAHLQFEHVRCFPCEREFGQKRSLYGHLTDSKQHNFCIRCESDFVSLESFSSHKCPAKDFQGSFPVPVVPRPNSSMTIRELGSDKLQNTIKESTPAMFGEGSPGAPSKS